MKSELEKKWGSTSGLLMLAGGEGHRGHREAAEIMAREVNTVIFAFEESEYLEKHKERGEFLPLNVRLSMWNLSPNVDLITVLPPKQPNTGTNTHYEELFEMSGATMQFVEVRDPFVKLKQQRTHTDMEFGANIYVCNNSGIQTTIMVEKLVEDLDLDDLLPMSVHESIFEL